MKTLKGLSLEDLLEEVSVIEEFENEASPFLVGWFAVVTDEGIIAYFGNEKDAFRFRLDYINQILNTI